MKFIAAKTFLINHIIYLFFSVFAIPIVKFKRTTTQCQKLSNQLNNEQYIFADIMHISKISLYTVL